MDPCKEHVCEDVVSLAMGYLNRELPPDVVSRLEAHLERCPSCISFVRTYEMVPNLTREALKLQMPQSLKLSLRDFLRQELKK